MKEMKLAYEELEIDGCFPDLLKTLGKRICDLDPKFRRRVEGEKKLTPEEENAINDDMLSFLSNINS